eukprot:8359457-Pyramimonas_sp.AAC.1
MRRRPPDWNCQCAVHGGGWDCRRWPDSRNFGSGPTTALAKPTHGWQPSSAYVGRDIVGDRRSPPMG